MRLSEILTIAMLACVLASHALASADGEFALEEIASGVYLHRGHYADLDDPTRADSANIGFIVGSRCVAVIDTGGAVHTGEALARAVQQIAAKPVCYVINTHVHFDHVLGNAAFVPASPHFAGHQALAEAMDANRDFFADSFAEELGGPGHQALVISPDLLVDTTMEIDLGGRTVVLTAVATAHTNTDLTVYDPTTDTLWAGDLLFRERMPVLDGSLKGWLEWMAAAMQTSYTIVVPGHGPLDRAWPAGAADQDRYLHALLDGTRKAIAAGEFLDEAKAGVASEETTRWLLTERAHPLNVSRAYRELEWE